MFVFLKLKEKYLRYWRYFLFLEYEECHRTKRPWWSADGSLRQLVSFIQPDDGEEEEKLYLFHAHINVHHRSKSF